MSSFEGLQERLAALQDSTVQLRGLIEQVVEEPELAGEISQLLKDGKDELRALKQEIGYVDVERHERERLGEGLQALDAQLTSCRKAFREARVAATITQSTAERLDHERLLDCLAPSESAPDALSPPQPQRHSHAPITSSLSANDQATVGASTTVTAALRRTHDLIAAELQRSEYAHDMLTESSAALRSLDESYSSLDGMLASSRDLLGTLLRSQKSDTWYLQTALYTLLVTGAWLVFRRWLYGPLWWVAWLPLRMMFGVGVRTGSAVMKGRGESGRMEVGGDGGRVSVEGLPDESLPTAKVGQEAVPEKGDPDSMVEQVAKIVDKVNEADDLGQIPADIEQDAEAEPARNTKKRMMEEPAVVGDSRPRDEL